MRSSRSIFIGSVVFFGLVLVFGTLFQQNSARFNGSLIKPATPADDFQLTDQNGNAYRLSDQQGKVVVLFFGYTHCPDFCPVTLAQFRDLKASLEEQSEQVEFVFITVDPEQDPVSRMKEYVDAFDPKLVGLTGTRSELELVWKNYGVYQEKHTGHDETDTTVDHSTRTYLVDQQGKLLLTYPFGFETDKIVQDIHLLLDSGSG